MSKSFKLPGQYLPWLLLLFLVDAFTALLMWIMDAEAFFSVAFVILLFTALLFFCVSFVLVRYDKKREQAFLAFLENPDEYRQEELLGLVSLTQGDGIRALGEILRKKEYSYTELLAQTEEYEEYVESWAHEIKTPLSLLSFLLDNRREELPEAVNFKLDYIRSRMQESVDQMLFYARLKGTKKDYLFEQIEVLACIEEVLEDYKPLLDEKGFEISCSLSDESVCTDFRGLRFLLGQVVSNSIKYCAKEPKIWFAFKWEDNFFVLKIRDNGIGVRSCDLPYIFDKGFTGDSGENRKKATGMGLYLARGIAQDLKLSLEADSEWGKGFEISVLFPIVLQGESFSLTNEKTV